MKRYWYTGENSSKNVYYTKNGFVPTYFMVNSSSKLFSVLSKDVEPDDAKRVQLVAVNRLVTSNPAIASDSLEAYNVSRSGYAAAVVYRVDKDASMYTRASWGIVSSASYALDKDGEKVIKLEVYNDSDFGFMYVKADNSHLGANAGEVISFNVGDCIRYESADGVTIEKYKKDFDAASKTLSYTAGNDYAALNYYYGRLEAVYSNSIWHDMISSLEGQSQACGKA